MEIGFLNFTGISSSESALRPTVLDVQLVRARHFSWVNRERLLTVNVPNIRTLRIVVIIERAHNNLAGFSVRKHVQMRLPHFFVEPAPQITGQLLFTAALWNRRASNRSFVASLYSARFLVLASFTFCPITLFCFFYPFAAISTRAGRRRNFLETTL